MVSLITLLCTVTLLKMVWLSMLKVVHHFHLTDTDKKLLYFNYLKWVPLFHYLTLTNYSTWITRKNFTITGLNNVLTQCHLHAMVWMKLAKQKRLLPLSKYLTTKLLKTQKTSLKNLYFHYANLCYVMSSLKLLLANSVDSLTTLKRLSHDWKLLLA